MLLTCSRVAHGCFYQFQMDTRTTTAKLELCNGAASAVVWEVVARGSPRTFVQPVPEFLRGFGPALAAPRPGQGKCALDQIGAAALPELESNPHHLLRKLRKPVVHCHMPLVIVKWTTVSDDARTLLAQTDASFAVRLVRETVEVLHKAACAHIQRAILDAPRMFTRHHDDALARPESMVAVTVTAVRAAKLPVDISTCADVQQLSPVSALASTLNDIEDTGDGDLDSERGSVHRNGGWLTLLTPAALTSQVTMTTVPFLQCASSGTRSMALTPTVTARNLLPLTGATVWI